MSNVTGPPPLVLDATLRWHRYENFFELYGALKTQPTLIYVIGETRRCYIGCVGCKKGKRGLASRYARQYLDRALAIFGLEPSHGQPSYAGLFVSPSAPSPEFVERIEKNIQKSFVDRHGVANALFTIKGTVERASIQHDGDRPPFL